jgi:hypothetical protein
MKARQDNIKKLNYRAISLMNIDENIQNKVLSKGIQQHITIILHCKTIRFILEC